MSFKSQKEIWEHLIADGKIIANGEFIASINGEGFLAFSDGSLSSDNFEDPGRWKIYQEPKPKRKITLYKYLFRLIDPRCEGLANTGELFMTEETTASFDCYRDHTMEYVLTESREIEVGNE